MTIGSTCGSSLAIPVTVDEDTAAFVSAGNVVLNNATSHSETAMIVNEDTAARISGIVFYRPRTKFQGSHLSAPLRAFGASNKNAAADFAPTVNARWRCASSALYGGTVED